MFWGLNNKPDKEKVIISLTESEVRLFLVEYNSHNINMLVAHSTVYDSLEKLNTVCLQWLQEVKAKGLHCHWLLSRDLYKTINLNKPKVPDSEIDGAIRWLVKDQVEQALDNLLITHYCPFTQDQDPQKLTAVIVERDFIEQLIEISDKIGINLISIEINELTASSALAGHLEQEKIVGLIDEDKQGLIYNFYVGKELAFTRHIKGRFFPNQQNSPFTLEDDNNEAQTDQFLLETQRTLDYCVSQIFRKPVNSLVLDAAKVTNSSLIDSLEQITELPVSTFNLASTSTDAINNTTEKKHAPIRLTIAEAGTILGQSSKKRQTVNFYLPQYQPKPLEFGFKFAASFAFLFVFGFITYGYIQEKEQKALTQQLSKENEALSKIQTSLQILNKELGKGEPVENLNNLIVRRQKELAVSKKLLSRVNRKPPTKTVSYSKVLAALSRQKTDSLWLTKIKLSPSSISLSGQTTKPKSIPSYINNMGKDPVLSSQFEDLSIERDKQDPRLINFQMSNGHYYNAN